MRLPSFWTFLLWSEYSINRIRRPWVDLGRPRDARKAPENAELLGFGRRASRAPDGLAVTVRAIAADPCGQPAPVHGTLADLSGNGYRRCNMAMGRNLMLMNLWDFPSLTLPVGKDPDGLPIGLQLSARRGSDRTLLGIAYAVERALGVPREILGSPPLCL